MAETLQPSYFKSVLTSGSGSGSPPRSGVGTISENYENTNYQRAGNKAPTELTIYKPKK
jgi:hypothetical protein